MCAWYSCVYMCIVHVFICVLPSNQCVHCVHVFICLHVYYLRINVCIAFMSSWVNCIEVLMCHVFRVGVCIVFMCLCMHCIHVFMYASLSCTGWRRHIGSPNMQIIFQKRATKYRSFLRKMTYKDKGSYES